MENGSMASGDSNLPRSLTDADFQAFSLEVAQARANAQGYYPRQDENPLPGIEAGPGFAGEGLIPLVPEKGEWVDDAGRVEIESATSDAITPRLVMAEDFLPIHCNLSLAELMEHALLRAEGVLSDRGALCVKTLPYGGTTAGSYYRVEPGLSPVAALEQVQVQRGEPLTPGLQLAPMDEKAFWTLYQRAMDYGEDKALYQCDGLVELGLPGQTTGIRVVCELASQAIMARHWLFPAAVDDDEDNQPQQSSQSQAEDALTHWSVLKPNSSHPTDGEQALADDDDEPRLTVIALNGLKGEPCVEPLLETEVFVVIHPAQRLALVGGSRHGGDLLGAIATLLADIHMHSSASGLLLQDAVHCLGRSGEPTALFLGEDGSGKQTLASALGERWQRGAVVLQPAEDLATSPHPLSLQPLLSGGYGNISGLTAKDRLHQHLTFGAVLENVPLQAASSRPRFSDLASSVPFRGAWQDGRSGMDSTSERDEPGRSQVAPQQIFLLVADTAGVLPAIARLSPEQAVYYFALGYGSALPGWSRHQLHPTAHFKAMDRQCSVGDCLRWQACLQAQPETEVYLVNTGWLGPMMVGERSLLQRIPSSISQALIQAALDGDLPLGIKTLPESQAVCQTCLDPVFGWTLPLGLKQLPGRWCQPWNVWGDAQQWRVAAIALARQFQLQMDGLVAEGLPEAIAQAGPCLPVSPETLD